MSYQINCSQGDDFSVQSNDEAEVISMVQEHASEKHDVDLDEDDARDMIEQSGM